VDSVAYLDLSNYRVYQEIYESSNSIIFRAEQIKDSHPVIIKLLNSEYPSVERVAKFKHEYEIGKSLDIDGVIKVRALETYRTTFFIVMEDIGGESLDRWIKKKFSVFWIF